VFVEEISKEKGNSTIRILQRRLTKFIRCWISHEVRGGYDHTRAQAREAAEPLDQQVTSRQPLDLEELCKGLSPSVQRRSPGQVIGILRSLGISRG
jgi:hypothetical protein